jgi:hypothetical protein
MEATCSSEMSVDPFVCIDPVTWEGLERNLKFSRNMRKGWDKPVNVKRKFITVMNTCWRTSDT